MIFLESTPGTNSPLSTLDRCEITPPAPKRSKVTLERHCILPSQRALIKPLPHNQIQVNQRKVKIVSRNAQDYSLFGKTVADNLLQCDPKDWTLDLLFDYEQGNLIPRSTPTTPFNNYSNFTFPNVAGSENYGYTGKTHAQQQNNQSSSGFQDYGYNKSNATATAVQSAIAATTNTTRSLLPFTVR